ncbi:MAG: sigma 54-interacting transcriptional regulator [Planctomycetota bacterium]
MVIPYRAEAIHLDGDLGEWPTTPSIDLDRADQVWSQKRDPSPAMRWGGAKDLEAHFWLAYDASRLWIAGRVRDDGLVAGKVGAEWHQGDAIELFFDLGDATAATGEFTPDVLQWFLMPFSAERPWGVMDWRSRPPTPSGASLTAVDVVFRQEAEGQYTFEAVLPFHNFPRVAGRGEIGFSIALDDHDPDRADRYQYMSWNGEQLVDHRENLGRLVFGGSPPLRTAPGDETSGLGWLAETAPYVLVPALSLIALSVLLWAWSRVSRRAPILRPLGRALGVLMFGAGLLLPGWLVDARARARSDRLRAAVDTLVQRVPDMEGELLGGYRGIDRDRTLIDLVDGRSIARENRYRYTMHGQLAGKGPALGARVRSYPGLGFDVRPYLMPLPRGEREILNFRDRVLPGRLNLVVARPLLFSGLASDPLGATEPADDVVQLEVALHRFGAAPVESSVEIPGPFLPTADPGLERMEISFRTIPVDQPIESLSLTCRNADGVRLVGITWLSSPDSDPRIVPLTLGSDTLGGVPTDLRGPWPADAGVELSETASATFPLVGVHPDEFQKLWIVFSGEYRRPINLPVGSHVAELTISFAEEGVAPRVVPFQHQRTMFFEQDRANRELSDDAGVRIAHRWEGDDKESHTDFVREIDLPEGKTPVAIELRNLGPYAIRFRSAILGSAVRDAPTSTADSPLVRGKDGELSLRPEIGERLRGISFSIYRSGRLSGATGKVDSVADRVVLPEAFRRIVPDDGIQVRTVSTGDVVTAEAYVALRGEAWSGTTLGATLRDEGYGDFTRFVHRVGAVSWLASLPILLLLFSEVVATLGSLRVRLVSVLSLASLVPLIVLSVVLVRVIESDHEQKLRERLQQEISSVDQQLAEQRTQLAASCDVWLGDLTAVVRARGLPDRNDTTTAFSDVLRPILQSQVPPSWADSCGLEFEFTPAADKQGASPVAVFVGAASLRNLDTQLRSETGAYLSWGVPILGVRRSVELAGQGTCSLSVARRIDSAFLTSLVHDRAALVCDLRGYPLAVSGSDAIAAQALEHHARRPAAMAAREAIVRDGSGGTRPFVQRESEGDGAWVSAYSVLFDVQNTPRLLLGVVSPDVEATLPLAVGRVPARAFFAAVAGLLALVAVFLSFVVTSRISRPIEQIERGAQALRRGELDVQVEHEETGQIGRLTRTFNQMAQELRGRIDDLHLLNRGIQTLASRLELSDVVSAAVGFCMRHAPADDVRILLVDRSRDRVELLGVGGSSLLTKVGDVDMLLSAEGACSVVLGEITPTLLAAAPGHRSALAFPLRLAGRSRGTLLLLFTSLRPPAVNLELLATIAAQTAAATENARLYQLAVEDVRTGTLRPEYFATRLSDEVSRAERDTATVALGGLRIEDGAALAVTLGDEVFGSAIEQVVYALRAELGPEALITRHAAFELRVAMRNADRVQLEAVLRRAAARFDGDRIPEVLRPLRWRVAVVAYPQDAASTEFLVDALGSSLIPARSGEPRIARDPGPLLAHTSPAMESVVRVVERVAPTDISVLLIGETGTGKEVIADLVHRWSARAKGPLVKVHCAALPESLLASELFGHEKGSFTGATERKLGRFEQANGGTIFLDEIGEVSADVQVKLLRVLQEREIDRVGGTHPIPVDVRIVAATNRDLEQMVREGRFREDLYYRLQGVLLRVPPLRERRSDIPALVEQFRLELFAAGQTRVDGFTPEAMDELFRGEWRGNVRELRNVVLRAMVLAPGPRVTRADLLWQEPRTAVPATVVANEPPPVDVVPLSGAAPVEQAAPPDAQPSAGGSAAGADPLTALPVAAASETLAGPDLDPPGRATDILRFIAARPSTSSQECADALGLSQRTALRILTELCQAGRIERLGKRRGARYRLADPSANPPSSPEQSDKLGHDLPTSV